MVETLKQLRALSDDEIIARYDQHAQFTQVGTGFYLDELRNRATDRLNRSVEKLTRWIFGFTIVVTIATLIQTGIAIYSLFKE